jgi:sensor histidine kinase YesM
MIYLTVMRIRNFLSNRYNQLEIAFFITYYLLFSVFSGLEYHLIEQKKLAGAVSDIPEQLMYGFIALLPGILFYKVLIQRFLFGRRYIYFAAGFIIYLFLLNLYFHGAYWLVSKLSFLPAQITRNAARWHASKSPLHFSIIFMLREFLVLSALAYFIRAAKQEKRIDALTNQQLQSELAVLKARVQPHFFFNTLNNIYSLTVRGSDKAAPLIVRYADIMRHILYTGSATLVPLKDEIAFLQKYVEVEAVRYPDPIRISFEQQGITDDAMIEPTLLLAIIENVFKHGLSQEAANGFAFILFSQLDDELSVEVSNSVSAVRTDNDTEGTGIGSLKKRLDLLYPGTHTLTIQEEDHIHRVSLILQIKRR